MGLHSPIFMLWCRQSATPARSSMTAFSTWTQVPSFRLSLHLVSHGEQMEQDALGCTVTMGAQSRQRRRHSLTLHPSNKTGFSRLRSKMSYGIANNTAKGGACVGRPSSGGRGPILPCFEDPARLSRNRAPPRQLAWLWRRQGASSSQPRH